MTQLSATREIGSRISYHLLLSTELHIPKQGTRQSKLKQTTNKGPQSFNRSTRENILPEEESDYTQKRLFKLLEETKCTEFTWCTHEAVFTSQEAAEVRGVSLASGAKAMLIYEKTKKEFSLLVLSASRQLDWKRVKKLLGKKAAFASQQQVFNVSKCLTGAVPPFGSLFNITTYMDRSLQEQGSTINFNCGLRTMSISMSLQDYICAEQPKIAEFSL